MPDLAAAVKAVAGLMADRCRVDRNPGGLDGALNPDGSVADPTPPATVYEGPCTVVPASAGPAQEGNVSYAAGEYWLMLPADDSPGVPLAVDDTVVVLASVYDPQLPGATFRVLDVPLTSWAVARRARMLLTGRTAV